MGFLPGRGREGRKEGLRKGRREKGRREERKKGRKEGRTKVRWKERREGKRENEREGRREDGREAGREGTTVKKGMDENTCISDEDIVQTNQLQLFFYICRSEPCSGKKERKEGSWEGGKKGKKGG